ncbi:MAG: hypothetical protein NTW06_04100 [Candidatus Falkowbacteria bacterium]|nr:hypothetical protein [Candidatus Falkowbacteria bacterium]
MTPVKNLTKSVTEPEKEEEMEDNAKTDKEKKTLPKAVKKEKTLPAKKTAPKSKATAEDAKKSSEDKKKETATVKKSPVKISVLNQAVVLPSEGEKEEKKNEVPVEKRKYFNEAKEEVKKQIDAIDLSMVKEETGDEVQEVKKSSYSARPFRPVTISSMGPKEFRSSDVEINKETEDDDEDEEEENNIPEAKPKRSLKLYRNIAWIFIAATLVLGLVIGYFTFVKITITLVPNQESINNNLILDVYDQEKNSEVGGNGILGVVKKTNVKVEKEYQVTGEEIIGKEAVGEATIINNYEKNQPLVATTRLLTPDGKLFRIKDTVNVPAGGSIKVEIYADQPSEEMAIGSSTFSIPGLWAGLQEKIYAQSDQSVVYQQKIKKSVKEEDLENSLRNLKDEVVNKAKEEIANNYKDFSKIIYSIDEKSIVSQINAKAGEEKEKFTGKKFSQRKIHHLATGK